MKKIIIAGTLSLIVTSVIAAEPASKLNSLDKSKTIVSQASSTPAKISLNQADVQYIAHAVKGIGEKRDQAIVQYRINHGRFKSIAELAQVPGIGAHFVAQHQVELEQVFSLD